jgi:glycosyltransferase involved in cell wall biosynthesis
VKSSDSLEVICFTTDWFSASKVSANQIVDCFYQKGAKVLWINPLPVRFPNTKRPDFWRKVQSKVKTHSRLMTHPKDRLFVYSPFYIPLFSLTGMKINRLLVSFQIRILLRLLKLKSPFSFNSSFTAWYALPVLKRFPMVFHFADKISSFREISTIPERRKILIEMELDLIKASNLVTCSSRKIFEYVSQQAGAEAHKVTYLPHGIDAAKFRDALKAPGPLPDDLKSIPKPIAGYFGSLTQTNDKETFYYAARQCPDWAFVFIGRVQGDYEALASLDNVYFLGQKSHEEIPFYGKQFDVCFMGWINHEWIIASNPVKTLEYLGLGKPVICSSYINELVDYSEFVRLTTTPQEFVLALREEYENDSAEKISQRLDFIKDMTWQARADSILQNLYDRKEK